MKIRAWKMIASGVLAACLAATSFVTVSAGESGASVVQNAPTYEALQYGTVGALPDGSGKIAVTGQYYNKDASKDHIENDDWDWDTMSSRYEVMFREGNPSMYLWPVGGFTSSFEQWHRAANIADADGVTLFVDFTNLLNPTDLRLGIRIDTSADGMIGDQSLLTKTYLAGNADCAYYDYATAEWVAVKARADGYIPLPDNFAGYVYAPASAFPAIAKDGKLVNCFMQMYHLDFITADLAENAMPIVFDNLEIVKKGSAHTHDFSHFATVEATCAKGGHEILACSCGQTKWQNITPAKKHVAGEKHAVSEGLSASLCSECGELEYFEESTTKQWEQGVTVTYEYVQDGVESVSRTYPKGYVLNPNDVPWIFEVREPCEGYDDIYQFFRWALDDTNVNGCDPLGLSLQQDLTVYASYNLISYNGQKYRAMKSDVSMNGGPYHTERNEGKVIFISASNFSLWHGIEYWYRTRGIPVLNNSIAGSTNHNIDQYLDELILMYKPSFVVSGIAFNDYNYHSMTDKQIVTYVQRRIERIHAASPNTQVLFVSPNTLPGRPEDLAAQARVSDRVMKLCENYDFVTYIDLYDLVSYYASQYPVGWDTWTHLKQEELANMFGNHVLPDIQRLMQEHNILFTPDQLIPYDAYENIV